MDFLVSIFSLAKNVTETDRQFKILKEKLVFHIKKAETALQKLQKQHHIHTFIVDNLNGRLRDAQQRLLSIENLLSTASSEQKQGISFKDKIKLSLPFNNERDKTVQTIEDLRQATEEFLNNDLSSQDHPPAKKKIQYPQQQEKVDAEIDQLYEMGPTIQENNALDFAMEFTKNHTVQLKVQANGIQTITSILIPQNKQSIVQKTCQRSSKQQEIQLFQLGRMNFKKQYKNLKGVFPDIDKVSKLSHFRIIWKRQITIPSESAHKQTQKTTENQELHQNNQFLSQKKEQAEQFFSVPEGVPQQMSNGTILLQKQKRCLYKREAAKWVKVEQDRIEVINGEEVAISLNKDSQADLSFKLTYRFK